MVRHYTANVVVSIPVGLAYEDEEPTKEQMEAAALENFISHPALARVSDLRGYVDNISVTEDVTQSKEEPR